MQLLTSKQLLTGSQTSGCMQEKRLRMFTNRHNIVSLCDVETVAVTKEGYLINMAVVSFLVEKGRWEDVYEQPQKQETAMLWSQLEHGWTPITNLLI